MCGWLADRVTSLDLRVQHVESSHEIVNVNGSFSMMHIQTRLRQDGSAAAAVVGVVVSFEPSWANPHWDSIGFIAETQAPQIVSLLKSAVSKLGPSDMASLDISVAALAKFLDLPLRWTLKTACIFVIGHVFLISVFAKALKWVLRRTGVSLWLWKWTATYIMYLKPWVFLKFADLFMFEPSEATANLFGFVDADHVQLEAETWEHLEHLSLVHDALQ